MEAIAKRMFGHTTMTFSNVLGPHEDISFFNHPMCYIAASALFGPHVSIILIMPHLYFLVKYKFHLSLFLLKSYGVCIDSNL